MSKKIIVAIDEINFSKAKEIINFLDAQKCMLKIGSVAFSAFGNQIINYCDKKGFEVFLDLKFHDIPNTVKKSILSFINLPIQMLTIHVSGGKEMIAAAMEAVSGTNIKIFGVTALTSLNNSDTKKIYMKSVKEQVESMLDIAEDAGIDGVVCSPKELKIVLKRKTLLTVTPGIRLKNLNDDQKRVLTPKDAINLGADFLVIGRPITSSNDIGKALNEIYQSII